MKSLKKKAIALFASIALVSMLAVPASANNHNDLYDYYGVASYSYTWTDSARYKEDMSSSWQECLNAPRSYTSWVYGSSTAAPQNLSQCYANLTKPGDSSSTTPRYSFSAGTSHYMQNWVRENHTQTNQNIPYAGMMFFGGSGSSYTIYIAWSPDSI